MTETEVFNLVRTGIYLTVGIPVPIGAAAAILFLPHSRQAVLLLLVIGTCRNMLYPTSISLRCVYSCRVHASVFGLI